MSKESNGCLGVLGTGLVTFAMISGLLGHSPSQAIGDLTKGVLIAKDVVTSIATETGINPFPTQNTSSQQQGTNAQGTIYKLSDGSNVTVPDWSLDTNPNYYVVVGTSNIDKAQFPEAGKISYSNLDSLGRTQVAKGSLTYENVKASYDVRQQFDSSADPSGWRDNEVEIVNGKKKIKTYQIDWLNGRSYRGVMWNRSHLIGDAIGGDAIRRNVITGTRPQNVGGTDSSGGMRYSEKKAQDWIENHHNGVLYYSSDPLYNGNELIPRAVIVSMLSSDNAINERVVVFNTANGYNINYNTGAFIQN